MRIELTTVYWRSSLREVPLKIMHSLDLPQDRNYEYPVRIKLGSNRSTLTRWCFSKKCQISGISKLSSFLVNDGSFYYFTRVFEKLSNILVYACFRRVYRVTE